MDTKLTIKNFRVFDEDGATINLKPLTILTGSNSSGKSSIVKSTFLLNSFLEQIRKAIEKEEPINLHNYKIDFTTYPNNLLGNFNLIVHQGSSKHKISIEYSVYSLMLSKDVYVELVFSKDKNDELNNAYLDSIIMRTEDGVFYSSSKKKGTSCHLDIIKNLYLEFITIEFLVHNFCGLVSEYEYGNDITKKEYDEQSDKMLSFLSEFNDQRTKDIYNYIRTSAVQESIIMRCGVNPKIIQWTTNNNSLFRIPVIEWLDTIKKEDIPSILNDNLLKNAPKDLLKISQKIISCFLQSKSKTFGDYFKLYENKECLKEPQLALFAKNESPYFLTSECFDFNKNFLTHDSYRASATIRTKDGDIIEPTNYDELKQWFDKPISFYMLYEVTMLWNEIYTKEDSDYYKMIKSSIGSHYYSHNMFNMLATFTTDLMREVINPNWSENIEYLSSTRVSVKRLYSLESNDDFSNLLKKYFEIRRNYKENKYNKLSKKQYEINSFINKWIKEFKIGESISFDVDKGGLGVQIRLHKKQGDAGRLLADEGFGITQLVSILLQIETAILKAEKVKINYFTGLNILDKKNHKDFGYKINTIAIEEPEIHLHPKYQSKLAEMFIEACSYDIHFIIETHSEYLIRKLQTLVAKRIIKAECISILYAYNSDIENRPLYTPQIKPIDIEEDGRLADSFGDGFFDEADKSAMELLTLKKS